MFKSKYKIILICFLIGTCLYTQKDMSVVSAAENLAPPQEVRVIRQTSRSLRIQWKKEEGASGYAVYRKNPGKKRYKKVKTITKSKTVKWTDKKVKPGKTYTYVVKSYKKINGKKVYSKNSDWASAKVDRQTDKKVNVGKVKLKKNLTLGIRMTAKCGAKLTPKKYKKGKGKKVISKKLRYRSSNPSIATVDKKGVVTAGVNTGNCYIYVTAHNGMTAKMKVTVVDYAKPDKFLYYDGRIKIINVLLNEYKNEVCNIASYFTKNKVGAEEEIYIKVNKTGNLEFTPSTVDCDGIREDLEKLLSSFPTYMHIRVTHWNISFIMTEDPEDISVSQEVLYSFNEDFLNLNPDILMASHWIYILHTPH